MTGTFSLTSTASIGGTVLTLEADVSDAGRQIRIGAASGVSLDQVWDQIRHFVPFDLPALPTEPDLWAELTETKLAVTAWVSSQPDGSLAASLDLTYVTPVSIPSSGSTFFKLFGSFATVEGLVIAYKPGDGGLTIQAKVTTPSTAEAAQGGSSPTPKQQLVGFPFPVPSQSAPPVFRLNYLGIGQRVGPDPIIPGQATAAQLADPLAAVFAQLETDLLGSDPAVILNRLARDFYKPDRDWFGAADVSLQGFRVRALFNDPSMYGLEITVAASPPNFFSGLLFEILYEKLGPGLGVYYGALTLPDRMRQIEIDGIILVLPGFSVWVYTNGDFRLNVGWPLGPSSIGIIVGPLTGQAGFTFAKLRSADNPSAGQGAPNFNPILQFGIAFDVYASVDCSAGPLSASLSVTLDTLLQGVIAWAAQASTDPNTAASVAGPPDYYWFAGSASLVILVQGSIDFTIIKATLSIQLSAQLSVAYETGHSTLIAVSAEVSVSLSVHLTLFTVHLSFDMRVSHSFVLGSGPVAQVDSPSQPGLVFTPLSAPATETTPPAPAAPAALVTNTTPAGQTAASLPQPVPARLTDAVRAARQTAFEGLLKATGPTAVTAHFALLPTATFDTTPGAFALVAALVLDCPAPDAALAAAPTGFEIMATAMLRWALGTQPAGTAAAQITALGAALGHGSGPPGTAFGGRDGFITSLDAALAGALRLTLQGVAGVPANETAGALLPAPPGLMLTVGTGAAVELGALSMSTAEVDDLNTRFAGLGLGPATAANGTATAAAHSLAELMLADYLLLLLRQLVGSIVLPQPSADPAADIAAALAGFDFAQLSGFASRFLIAGMQLPDPVDATRQTALFRLTGQQFAAGPPGGTVTATLAPKAGAGWIVGSASSSITLPAAAPAKPDYAEATGATPAAGQWVARQMSGLALAPLQVALNQRTAVQGSTDFGTLLGLPTQILPGPGATTSVSLALSVSTPDGGGAAAPAAMPALLVALAISRVQRPAGTGGGTVFLPGVYQVRGTDDATRELLHALLEAFALLGAQPLPPPPVTLLTSFPGSQALATVGAKVLAGDPTAPPTLMLVRTVPPTAAQEATESASSAAPGAFLRLLWEACVAQGNGVFLYDNTCLGGSEDQVFGTGPAATIDLLIAVPPSASAGATGAVPPWANRLAMGNAVPAGTVVAGVSDGSGNPVMTASPAAPAGSLGIALDIARRPAPPVGQPDIDGLYHLVQYAAVPVGAAAPQWSLPVGPTDNPASDADWSYRQTFPMPVAAGSTSAYAAINRTLPLQFRLIDVFGNALPDLLPAAAPGIAVRLLYTDRLIAPAAWPGVRLAYSFLPGDASGATLQLLLSFDGTQLQASFKADAGLLGGTIARYAAIVDQMSDGNVTAALVTDLDGGAAPETAGPLKAALLGFAQSILTALGKLSAAGATLAADPVTLTRPVAFADVLAQPVDVLALGVWITLARPADLADPDAPERLPEAISTHSPVPPLLDLPGTAGTTTLTSFARTFEAAFAAMATAGRAPTQLRLAQRAATPSGDTTDGTPDLWAVRFGGAGFGIATPASDIHTTYALRPLSTQLLSGALPDGTVCSDIDLDATVAPCLQAIDAALSPARAVALALLGPADPAVPLVTWLDRLLAAKRQLAATIPAGLAKVLPSDPDGDVAAARAALQTALLTALGSAASITCVVQAGVAVAVQGTPGDALDVATPPMLLGDIGAVPAGSGVKNNHFYFSSASLTLSGPTELPAQPNQILTTVLSVADPSGQTELAASLSWSPAFLRHDVETAETYAGFTPSSWLKFILPGAALPLGNATIPLPLWLEPTRPALTSHAASAAAGAGTDRSGTEDDITGLAADIAQVLQWQYSAQLAVALDAQDALWVDPGFNAVPAPALPQSTLPPAELPFFQAAVGFARAVPALAPTLALLDGTPPTGAALAALRAGIGRFVGFAEQLAAGWPQSGLVATVAPAPTPQGMMLTADAAANRVEMRLPATATPPSAEDWPALAFGDPPVAAPPDAAPSADGTAWVRQHTVKTGIDLAKTTLTWSPLAFKDRISGNFRCWIARNPALVPGSPTADAFVFRTPVIGFPSPLVPLLVSAGLPRIRPSVPLVRILRLLLDQLATVGGEASQPVVSIECTYCAQLLPVLTQGAGAAGLVMRMPVLMGADVPLPADTAALAGTLTAEIAAWLRRTAPVERDAVLDFAVTLFGVPNAPDAQQLPLVRLDQVVVELTGAGADFWTVP